MTEAIFRQESKYPQNFVPDCWKVFNKEYSMDRGLFFQDGKKWHSMRNKMNPLLLKDPGIRIAKEHSKRITDDLIKDLIHQADANAQWYFFLD